MTKRKQSVGTAHAFLSRRIQHIFNKDPVSSRRVIHQHVGHRTHQFPVLNDRTAAHE